MLNREVLRFSGLIFGEDMSIKLFFFDFQLYEWLIPKHRAESDQDHSNSKLSEECLDLNVDPDIDSAVCSLVLEVVDLTDEHCEVVYGCAYDVTAVVADESVFKNEEE